MKVTLNLKDVKDFRSFQLALQKQLGPNSFVGTDHACVVFNYPEELRQAIRPFGENLFKDGQPLEFELAVEEEPKDQKALFNLKDPKPKK